MEKLQRSVSLRRLAIKPVFLHELPDIKKLFEVVATLHQ